MQRKENWADETEREFPEKTDENPEDVLKELKVCWGEGSEIVKGPISMHRRRAARERSSVLRQQVVRVGCL